MHKQVTSLFAASLMSLAFASTASAQDYEEPMGGDSMGDSSTGDSSSSSASSSSSNSGGAWGPYSMAISTTFPTGGDGGAANILYGLDADTFLDLGVGVNFNKGTFVDPADPTMTTDETTFGIELSAGYRMYKPLKSRIRPYPEPFATLAIDDFSAAGDTIFLAAGGLFGVDYLLMDQFSLGTGVGGALVFADGFDTINFGLFTASINATFWW